MCGSVLVCWCVCVGEGGGGEDESVGDAVGGWEGRVIRGNSALGRTSVTGVVSVSPVHHSHAPGVGAFMDLHCTALSCPALPCPPTALAISKAETEQLRLEVSFARQRVEAVGDARDSQEAVVAGVRSQFEERIRDMDAEFKSRCVPPICRRLSALAGIWSGVLCVCVRMRVRMCFCVRAVRDDAARLR